MPVVDFSSVKKSATRGPLPAGTYVCRIADVEEQETRAGHEMWRIRFAVEEGPHKGRWIYDRLVFSPAALKRLALFCQSIGLAPSGEMELTPDMVIDRRCRVRVETEEYTDQEGNTRRGPKVPFGGYSPIQDDDSEEEPPF